MGADQIDRITQFVGQGLYIVHGGAGGDNAIVNAIVIVERHVDLDHPVDRRWVEGVAGRVARV